MNVSLVRLTTRQWARIPDRQGRPDDRVELWGDVPAEELAAALDELEPRLAEVLVMHDLQGTPPAEIAARTALRPATVVARIVRGRLRLQRLLRHRALAGPTGTISAARPSPQLPVF